MFPGITGAQLKRAQNLGHPLGSFQIEDKIRLQVALGPGQLLITDRKVLQGQNFVHGFTNHLTTSRGIKCRPDQQKSRIPRIEKRGVDSVNQTLFMAQSLVKARGVPLTQNMTQNIEGRRVRMLEGGHGKGHEQMSLINVLFL